MAHRSPELPHTPPAAAQEADQRAQKRRRAPLEAPRRAHARQVPHKQPEIDAADLDEQPFQDIGMPAQMDAAHPVWCNKAAEVGESAKQGRCEWLLPQ